MRHIAIISFFLLLGAFSADAQKPSGVPNEKHAKPIVKIFPNPAVNYINFEFKEPQPNGTTILIYSFLGRQVASIPVNTDRITVNVTNYFRGVYVFQVRLPNGKVVDTNKFQVNH